MERFDRVSDKRTKNRVQTNLGILIADVVRRKGKSQEEFLTVTRDEPRCCFFFLSLGEPVHLPRLLRKTTKVLCARFTEATPLLHTRCVSIRECARLFYLQLQPWFALPAALPEPANDRISLT